MRRLGGPFVTAAAVSTLAATVLGGCGSLPLPLPAPTPDGPCLGELPALLATRS